MFSEQGKGNSVSEEGVSPALRERRKNATAAVSSVFQLIENREKFGERLSIHAELYLVASAFLLGARGSKTVRLPKGDADRATNELIDTGSIAERGVRLWIRFMDGVTGSDGGGWAVGYEVAP